MFSKDIARKPFFVRTGQDVRDVRMYVRTYVRTDVRTRVMLYAPPPIINGGGIIIVSAFLETINFNNQAIYYFKPRL